MNRDEDITHRGTAYPWHCDHVGHVNVMHYAARFDEATWNLFAQIGLTPSYFRASRRGMAEVDQHIEYRRELLAGDVITIRSRVLEIHARKIRFRHELRAVDGGGSSGPVSAVCTLLGVHVDTAARQACPFPADVIARAGSRIQPQPPGPGSDPAATTTERPR